MTQNYDSCSWMQFKLQAHIFNRCRVFGAIAMPRDSSIPNLLLTSPTMACTTHQSSKSKRAMVLDLHFLFESSWIAEATNQQRSTAVRPTSSTTSASLQFK